MQDIINRYMKSFHFFSQLQYDTVCRKDYILELKLNLSFLNMTVALVLRYRSTSATI